MKNFNTNYDIPGTYIYNKYNFGESEENKKIEVNIDQVAFDLLECSNDRKKFDILMKKLENEFMGVENQAPDSDNYRKKKENKNTDKSHKKIEESLYENQNFNKKNTNLNESSNVGNYNQMTTKTNFQNYNHQNYKSSSVGKFLNDSHHKSPDQHSGMNDITQNNNFHHQNKQNEFMQGAHHRKYTDVHANTKFYYPTDYYNSYEQNDLYVEPSQWTNRANTRTLYSHNKLTNDTEDYSHTINRSNLHTYDNNIYEKNYFDKPSSNYYANQSSNSTFGNSFYGGMSGKFNKDNTNSAILSKQFQRNATGNSFGIFYPNNQDF